MDVQAKDRLTGAVILVALLVLIVPEVLSGPERSGAALAAAQSPGEPALRSYSVDLGDVRHAPAAGSATAPIATTASTAAPTQAAASATSGEESAPPAPQVETPAAAIVRQPPATAVVRQPPASMTPQAAPVRPSAAPAKAAQPVRGAWTVQLGSFSSQANAERLVHELQGRGFAAFLTESSSGGRRLYRVRVGPASDHAGAAALAARLRSAGHPGSLTEHP